MSQYNLSNLSFLNNKEKLANNRVQTIDICYHIPN